MKNKAKLSTLSLAILAMTISGCCGDAPEENGNEQNNSQQNNNGQKAEPLNPVISTETKAEKISRIVLDRNYASLFYNDDKNNAFNEEITIEATCFPRSVEKRKIIWTSSNPAVATVDENGTVKAVSEGFAEVTAANEDDSVKESVHIVVNNMNSIKIAQCNERMDSIMSAQLEEDFEIPDVITCVEKYDNVLTKNGETISRTSFTQTITTSLNQAFIQLDAEEYNWRCEGGSPSYSTVRYVFYTTDEFVSYLFKTTGKIKNYIGVNQSSFLGQEKIEALRAICQNFFISGAGILDGNYEDILMTGAKNWIKSSIQNTHYGRMADVPGQLAFDLHDSYDYVATKEDESDMNIPTGTPYKMNVQNRLLYENNLLTGRKINQDAIYSLDGNDYVNAITVDNYYKTNTEIVFPDKNDGYSLVENIFDL